MAKHVHFLICLALFAVGLSYFSEGLDIADIGYLIGMLSGWIVRSLWIIR